MALDGYERRIGRYGGSLARAFIVACGVTPPQRVLDVGCGTGALTAELAAALGPGNVAGADPDPVSVDLCRRRLPDVDLRVAPAEALPYEDASFDAALAQLVVAFMHDAEAGVREMRRVVRPGGALGACVWDFGSGMRALRAFWDAAAEVDPGGAALHDQAAAHAYATAESLEQLWRAAEVADVRTGALQAETAYAGHEDLWEPMTIPDGSPGRYLALLDAAAAQAIRQRMLDGLGVPDEPFTLTARAWFVTGRNP